MSSEQAPPNFYAEPAKATDPEPALSPRRPSQAQAASVAQRLAGGFLIANAILLFLELALAPAGAAPPGSGDSFALGYQTGQGSRLIVPAILDLFIGGSLALGSARFAKWAMYRAVLGVLLVALLHFRTDPFVAVYQGLFLASLIGLLAGRADRIRTAIAGSITGLCLLVEVAGLAVLATGGNPIAALIMAASGDIEPAPVGRLEGRTAPYEITFPNKQWYLRKQEVVTRENPLADRWLVRPDRDMHVLILAEHAPSSVLPIDAYVDAVLKQLREDTPNVDIYSRTPWRAFPERGRIVKARGIKAGLALEWTYAFVTTYGRAYYLLGLTSHEAFPAVEGELLAIFETFKLPDSVLDALPADVDPAPVTEVRGLALPYLLRAPDPRWHLRKQEAVQADNPVIDRWLTAAEQQAHIIVVAEQVEKGPIPLPAYVDAILTGAEKGSTRFEVKSRVPWAKFPGDGVRVRVSLAKNDVELEYDYGLYAKGNRAFQVTGFSARSSFASVEEELGRAIDSFEPPP
jgi:hypothetical protein